MSAIVGRYMAPNQGIRAWVVDWMHDRKSSSPRYHLSNQLRYIRKAHGNHEAIEFSNYLTWLCVYPVKIRH